MRDHHDGDFAFANDFNSIVEALADEAAVLNGCAVDDGGTNDMSVDVASGEIRIGGEDYSVSSQPVTLDAADGSEDRYDLVVVGTDGNAETVTGTPSPTPQAPSIPANHALLAIVEVRAGVSELSNADINDARGVVANRDPPIFGDGSDGAISHSSAANVGGVVNATTWEVEAGTTVTLDDPVLIVFATNSITVSGTIDAAGMGATGGGGGTNDNGSNGGDAAFVPNGTGGSGGGSSNAYNGGSGGAGDTSIISGRGLLRGFGALPMHLLENASGYAGAGGGGGGASFNDTSGTGSDGTAPGGGGGGGGDGTGGGSSGASGGDGGGCVILIAPNITITGTVDVSGQDGEDTSNNAGAGGGGSGGVVGLYCYQLDDSSATYTIAGGAGGSAGGAGGDGAAGADGLVIKSAPGEQP